MRHPWPPSCGTDPRSLFRRGAAQDALPLAAGTPGRTRAGSKARRHPWRARRRRAHPPASARAGKQAAVAPPCPLRRATMASGRRLRSWREKTERENEPRVCGRRGVAEFCSREKSARPSDLDRRRRTAGNGGRRMGQIWPKRGAAPGRFGGLAIGCWAEGPGVARAERAGPISCLGCFNSESSNCFFYFPEAF